LEVESLIAQGVRDARDPGKAAAEIAVALGSDENASFDASRNGHRLPPR
tara:strand:+ start:1215 stop:1361 length:147 start_codon:yes stop_codon:yes gene_type:complete